MKKSRLFQSNMRFGMLTILAVLAIGLAGCGATAVSTTAATTTVPATSATTAQTSAAAITGMTSSGSTTAPAGSQTSGTTGTISKKLTAAEGKALLAKTPGAILLDVRTPAEHKEIRIPGSLLIPVDELPNRLSELPKDPAKPIVIYCRSGNRSATAAAILVKAGVPAVYDMGGIIDWPYETEKG